MDPRRRAEPAGAGEAKPSWAAKACARRMEARASTAQWASRTASVISLSDPSGLPADRRLTEAWVRALVPEDAISAVHELPSARAATYVWLVDGHFNPIASPSSMFEGLTAA